MTDSLSLEQADSPVVLRTAGLSRRFGKVQAVDGLDLSVREGEIYGFLGRNGAGKTTTIRMLMGMIKPDAGSIELLGQTTSRTTLAQKRVIGYVSQEQTFYQWMTCRGLGRFVGGFYPTWDAAEFERLLGLLDIPAQRKVSQLSGGTKVKLALALALAHRPALLILDEPTSGLDPVARREFLDLIQQQALNHNRTTFFSSHRIDEVERVANRVGIINNGRLQYEGDTATLLESVRLVECAPEPTLPPPSSPAEGPPPFAPPSLPQGDLAVGEVKPSDPGARPLAWPPGYTILRETRVGGSRSFVVQANPESWDRFALPGREVRMLSLEDLFIALVGTPAQEV